MSAAGRRFIVHVARRYIESELHRDRRVYLGERYPADLRCGRSRNDVELPSETIQEAHREASRSLRVVTGGRERKGREGSWRGEMGESGKQGAQRRGGGQITGRCGRSVTLARERAGRITHPVSPGFVVGSSPATDVVQDVLPSSRTRLAVGARSNARISGPGRPAAMADRGGMGAREAYHRRALTANMRQPTHMAISSQSRQFYLLAFCTGA